MRLWTPNIAPGHILSCVPVGSKGIVHLSSPIRPLHVHEGLGWEGEVRLGSEVLSSAHCFLSGKLCPLCHTWDPAFCVFFSLVSLWPAPQVAAEAWRLTWEGGGPGLHSQEERQRGFPLLSPSAVGPSWYKAHTTVVKILQSGLCPIHLQAN